MYVNGSNLGNQIILSDGEIVHVDKDAVFGIISFYSCIAEACTGRDIKRCLITV